MFLLYFRVGVYRVFVPASCEMLFMVVLLCPRIRKVFCESGIAKPADCAFQSGWKAHSALNPRVRCNPRLQAASCNGRFKQYVRFAHVGINPPTSVVSASGIEGIESELLFIAPILGTSFHFQLVLKSCIEI